MTQLSQVETNQPVGAESRPRPRRASILFLTHHPREESGTWFRIYQFLPYLESAGFDCTIRAFTSPQLFSVMHRRGNYGRKAVLTAEATARRLSDLVRAADFDLVYIHREVYPFGTPLPERLFYMRNKKLIFSFDDAIYAGHASTDSLADGWLYRLKYGERVNWVIRNSMHVVVGNRFLKQYSDQLNPSVSIVPTVVDTETFRAREYTDHTPIRIGWMGSSSTSPYLRPLVPVFEELARRYGERIEFHIQGDPDFPAFDRAVIHGYRLDSGGEGFRSFDIGIMPMPDDVWTRGKCAFKAIQCMAVGAATVASPIGMVDELIQDGRTGLLASSPEEWFRQLSILIENADLRRELGLQGRTKVEQEFSLKVWGPRFSSILRNIYDQSVDRR